MTLRGITIGNYGNGNYDILEEELITRRHFFIPICVCILYHSFAQNIIKSLLSWVSAMS
jgi:hypothetical protein